MKKSLMLLAMTGFIAINACQSTKTENTEAAADSVATEQSAALVEEMVPVDSTATLDSAAQVVAADSIQ